MAKEDTSPSPAIAIRSSAGVEVWKSSYENSVYEQKDELLREETKNSRAISFSPDGAYFSYANGLEVVVLQTINWQVQWKFPRPKACFIKFSSRGNYLSIWEQFTTSKNNPEEEKNLFVFDLKSGLEVFSILQKKPSHWEPSWSSDESIFSIVVAGEALFFVLTDRTEGFKSPVKRIGGVRGGVVSLGPGNSTPFLALYTPGTKGGPSMCKLYKYPALAQTEAVGCRSFFQADQVKILWNKTGTCLLILASTEVDKSGASYYGNQSLHFMSVKGSSCSVPLSKDGPVHCVNWSPKATEFVVVYGLMPSKVALFNLKCDLIFDFGDGPRNYAFFNSFGNLIVLAGFGNLPGNMEVWDLKKKEKVNTFKAADTTYFEWNPNGDIFLTATTAPRLRVGNGFKVWHYSGALLHEMIYPEGHQLLDLTWQNFPEHTFTEHPLTNIKINGIKSIQPEPSKQVYQPPNMRTPKNKQQQPTAIRELRGENSTNKGRSKFGRQNKPKELPLKSDMTEPQLQNLQNPKKNQQSLHSHNDGKKSNENKKDESSEKNKRLVAKKLSDIKKLKDRQEKGETLELNQLKKISMEKTYLEQLKTLKLSS